MNAKKPARIYDYFDFREFLRDRYAVKKKESAAFSYRYIAGKIGLDAGSFSRILTGSRNLNPEMTGRLARVFGLDDQEKEFFVALVLYGQAKSHEEKSQFLEKIFKLRGVSASTLEESQYEFYKEWYHSAMRQLLHFYHFDGDHARLAKVLRPAIRPAEAKHSLKLLETIGLVETTPEGKLRLTEAFITSGESVRAFFVNNLHIAMGELASRAIKEVDPKERDFSGLTLSLSSKGFENLKAKLKQFRKDVFEMAEQDGAVDRVYQVNLQAFPLSRQCLPGDP
jgi:uncharacterized protein (TIGR02147 family)